VLEARWDAGGAVCLETPRAALSSSPAVTATFPDVLAAIAAVCPVPPSCQSLHGNTDPNAFAGTYVVTANPL
jgi:hypothetical protein